MDRDKECITAEYQCIFGVSEPITSLQPGETHTSSDVDHSSLLFVGKDSLPQWFFISKMDQKYRGSSIPRFTESQKDEMINKHKDHMFKEGVSFANLIKTTSTMGFLALEEARHRFWTHGRIVCVGDSVHKMTPNVCSDILPTSSYTLLTPSQAWARRKPSDRKRRCSHKLPRGTDRSRFNRTSINISPHAYSSKIPRSA